MKRRYSEAFLHAVLDALDFENPAHRALLLTPSGAPADLPDAGEVIRRGNRYHLPCPLPTHRGDNDGRNFVYYPDRRYFKCFSSCGYVGNAFHLIARVRGVSFPEAVRLLAECVGLDPSGRVSLATEREQLAWQLSRSDTADRPVPAVLPALPEAILRHFAGRHHPAMDRYGLRSETWAQFRSGYCPDLHQIEIGGAVYWALSAPPGGGRRTARWLDLDGNPLRLPPGRPYVKSFADRIVFSITDARGRLVGISGRALNPHPAGQKYEHNHGFEKSQVLFNLPTARRLLLAGQPAFFAVEGFADAMRLTEWQIPAGAVMGAAMSPQQAYLIRSLGAPVYLAFDGDQGGVQATISAVHALLRVGLIHMRALILPDGRDPGELSRDELLTLKENAVGPEEYLRRFAPRPPRPVTIGGGAAASGSGRLPPSPGRPASPGGSADAPPRPGGNPAPDTPPPPEPGTRRAGGRLAGTAPAARLPHGGLAGTAPTSRPALPRPFPVGGSAPPLPAADRLVGNMRLTAGQGEPSMRHSPQPDFRGAAPTASPAPGSTGAAAPAIAAPPPPPPSPVRWAPGSIGTPSADRFD